MRADGRPRPVGGLLIFPIGRGRVVCATGGPKVRIRGGLRFTATLDGARLSSARPEMGLVAVAISLFNRDGACAMSQPNATMVALRKHAASRAGTASGDTVERGTETQA